MAKNTEKVKRFCEKCERTKDLMNFYKSNNKEKYPDGYLNICKDCLTARIDNWDKETYLWILQECDVPYVPEKWNDLLARWGSDRSSVKGTTIIGRYLASMRLNQFKNYRWKDTQFIQDLMTKKRKETMELQGYSQEEINKAVLSLTQPVPEEVAIPKIETKTEKVNTNFSTDFNDKQLVDDEDVLITSLTTEDKIYLRMKWGKSYRPDEWVQLEKLYKDMMESYDIQGAGHEDTLKLVCKTSLKSNQLLDLGDVEGAQKMIRMYDVLMKNGRFTAAQNKSENGEGVDSVSEIVAMCETDGFIPRYYTDGPQDKVDRTLQDLQSYTHSLITEEMNLGNLIEQAVKQIQQDKEKEALRDADAAADDDEAFENDLFAEHDAEIKDDEFEELQQMIEREEENDEELLASFIDQEDIL